MTREREGEREQREVVVGWLKKKILLEGLCNLRLDVEMIISPTPKSWSVLLCVGFHVVYSAK